MIIDLKDINKTYPGAVPLHVLKDINLSIDRGELVSIMGASGSGKSTLLNIIGILDTYDSGEYYLDGVEIRNLSENRAAELRNKLIGFVFQSFNLISYKDAVENVALPLFYQGVSRRKRNMLAMEQLERMGLADRAHHLPGELSGGQKQRVSLAGVMVEDVKVLLFDEPLANLDPAAGRATIELIDMVHERTGAAVLIIEHRLEDVLWRRMDRIILMKEGEIVADMPVAKLLSGNLLLQHGIREPLYLTALRYAGVEIREALHPEHVNSLKLDQADKEKVRSWYHKQRADIHSGQYGQELLRAEKLTFGYTADQTTLQDVSFTIHKGEMVSIVGRNGAGKSTLAKLICGFEQPASGSIYMEGRDLKGDTIKERAARIGYVMQNPNQMISKPMIWDEVEMALLQNDMPKEERSRRVEETLKVCGLYPFRNWPVSALSFGQKKRVTIASILVQRPQIIILDEPTAGQDYRHYTEIMDFLKELNGKGYTILMITHDMHLMLEYTKRAIVFSEGTMLADTTAAHVLTDPGLVEAANLKETSLYTLSLACGIEEPQVFTECFIGYEQKEGR